jgi:2-dehydropantoate 2-reductase
MSVKVENVVAEAAWPKIVVVGAGAVGSYFGGMLARSGAPVTLIGRQVHVDEMSRHGLIIDRADSQEKIQVHATTDVAAVREADLVLFSVKTFDTESTAKAMLPNLKSDATVISFQNGVNNVDLIRSCTGVNAFVACVYVAVQFAGPGKLKHNGRGDLIVGDVLFENGLIGNRKDKLEAIVVVLRRAGIPCEVSRNIRAELWTKLVMNCAYNGISALADAPYSKILGCPLTKDLLTILVRETIEVAGAEGIELRHAEVLEGAYKLGESMPMQFSSTAQDIRRGKHTEIDSLNGYVSARGKALGIPTPANAAVHALVKLKEQNLIGKSARE